MHLITSATVTKQDKLELLNKQWKPTGRQALRKLLWATPLGNSGHGTLWEVVLELLTRAYDNTNPDLKLTHGRFYDPADDASERWVEFGACVLESFGWIEYGTGVGSSWLTPQGTLVLRFLQDFGTNDSDWPIWAETDVED